MEHVTYNGTRYRVSHVSGNEVIVNLPERMIVGHQSRMPIPLEKLSPRARKAIQQEQVNELNHVIYRSGLYGNGKRYVFAHIHDGQVCVERLCHEGEHLPVLGLRLGDGYGNAVTI